MLRESGGRRRRLTWRAGNNSFSSSKSSKDYMLYRRTPSIVHPQIEETLEKGTLWEGSVSSLTRQRFKMSKWKKICIRITASTLSFYVNDQVNAKPIPKKNHKFY